MLVSELIELLREYPSDLLVVVNGYEEGYDDLSPRQISTAKISLNTGTHHWEGRHGEPGPFGGRDPGQHRSRRGPGSPSCVQLMEAIRR